MRCGRWKAAIGSIAAALESEQAWFGMIVDGVHVAPSILRLALRGRAKPIVVTDAMPPVGGTHASFQLQGETILVRGDRMREERWQIGRFGLTMADAVRKLRGNARRSADRRPAVCPARLAEMLGLDKEAGQTRARFPG